MEFLRLNLGGLRCPDVMGRILKGLRLLEESDNQHLVIETVEPSVERDLRAAIFKEHSLTLRCMESSCETLTPEIKDNLIKNDPLLFHDDLEELTEKYTYLVSKIVACSS